MYKLVWLFVIIILLLSPSKAISQCIEDWDKAQSEFKEGHLYSIPSILSGCLQDGFTKSEKVEAYRMLTITYLYIDDPYGAQNSFIGLLKLDPEYRIKPTDPVELEQLSKEYITTPIISWRVRGGINYSFVSVIHTNGSGNAKLNSAVYKPLLGYNAVGSLDVHFNKLISLGIDVDVSLNSYNYTNHLFDDLEGNQNAKDFQNFKETGLNASLPIYLKFTYPGVKYYPYVYGGYSPNYNIYTNSTASYRIIQEVNENPIEPKKLDISLIRNRFSNSVILGAGLMRRYKYNYIFIDVRYRLGLNKLLNEETQFDFADLEKYNANPNRYKDVIEYTEIYEKIDSQFKESDLSLTLGYVWPKYKPRKKKSVTFGGMLKEMFKKKGKDE
ncbi:MAG: hypothetical protein KDC79_14365 [Cyclobacteriaceae bacterium]|nr:hypothetical protein [Cyclobacteriaceae bacterium]